MLAQPNNHATLPQLNRERLRLGIRIALEEMVLGRDYARVEDILRALTAEAEKGPALPSSATS